MSDFIIEDSVLKEYTGEGGDVVIPDGVTEIGQNAFEGCDKLLSVSISNNVTVIESWAFKDCTNLAKVVLPEEIEDIMDFAFEGCVKLSEITFPASMTEIEELYLETETLACNGVNVNYVFRVLGDKVKIQSSIFEWANSVVVKAPHIPVNELTTKIKMPAVHGFLEMLSDGETIDEVVIESYRKYIKGQREKLLDEAAKNQSLLLFMINESILDINNVDTLLSREELSVESRAALMDYREKAFSQDVKNDKMDKDLGLRELTTAELKKIWKTEKNKKGDLIITQYKGTDTDITIPSVIGKSKVVEIGQSVFKNCSELTSAIIPDGVTEIGEYAFFDCGCLTNITIPKRVKKVGECAFFGCNGLADSQGFIVVKKILFGYCGHDDCVIIPDGVTEISALAFLRQRNLVGVTIPNGVKKIGDYAFSNCKGLTSVTIPDSVTEIGLSAFIDCSCLTSITIPDSVTEIGDRAFFDCGCLTNITIPNSVKKIEEYTFKGCKGLANVTIPDGVTEIGWGAFSGCSNLTSVTIPSSVTEMGNNVFSGCVNLTVYAPKGSKAIEYAKENNIKFVEE